MTIATFLAFSIKLALADLNTWSNLSGLEKALMAFLNFTFLRGFFEQFKFSGIAQGWTLTVEECFYLSAPLLLLLLSKIKSHYVVLSMFLLAMIATGCLLVALLPHYYGLFDSYKFMFYRTFFGRSFEFVLGAALALVVQRHPDARRGCWLTALGVLWLLGSMIALRFIGSAQSSSIDTPLGIAVNNLVIPPGIGLLFYGLITERTWLSRLLETPVAQVLGKSSYAFYLIHVGILSTFVLKYINAHSYVVFVFAVAGGIILWKWVEEPLNLRIREAYKKAAVPKQVKVLS